MNLFIVTISEILANGSAIAEESRWHSTWYDTLQPWINECTYFSSLTGTKFEGITGPKKGSTESLNDGSESGGNESIPTEMKETGIYVFVINAKQYKTRQG